MSISRKNEQTAAAGWPQSRGRQVARCLASRDFPARPCGESHSQRNIENLAPPRQPLAIGARRSSRPCAPSCTLPRNSRRKAVKQSLPAPENLRALLEAMLNPLQHTPGTFIREAAEPSEAAFTGDCAFCLPSQRRTKHQTVLAASWRRRSTRDRARPGVLGQRRLAAQPPNSPAPLAAQSTVLRDKRRSQAEKEITNQDDSTTITEKINPGRHSAGAW